jgi:hypothetical protein
MAHPKDQHYWAQLRIAQTAGRWSSPAPARAPNGKPLSWAELFRKFNKHCSGYSEVAEVASQTLSLSLLLGAYSIDEDQGESNFLVNGIRNGSSSRKDGVLSLGMECLLPPERQGEAQEAYESLKRLKSENFDVRVLGVIFIFK